MTVEELPPVTASAARPAPAADVPRLRVGGMDYFGWTQLRVTRGIDRMAADFDLQVVERWTSQAPPWQITPFSPCEIFLGEDLLLTGYVDGYFPAFDARGHFVRIIGRSKTEDLIDCTPEIEGGEFRGATLDAIARRVCQPFGIEVVVETDTGDPFDLAAFERTETGFDFLERLGRLRGVLLTDDEEGRLVLTRAGGAFAAGQLVQGENVLRAQGELNVARRHSKYIILGQRGGESAATWQDVEGEGEAEPPGGAPQTAVMGSAIDPNVPRYRPRVSLAETALTPAEARQRALWQAAYFGGRSTKARITVQGWRQEDGTLWRINRLVPVQVPFLQLDQDLLIAGVTFCLDPQGRTTELELGPVQGFTPDPGQVKRRKPKGGSGGNQWLDVVPVQ